MSRVRTLLSCSECGQPASQWAGRCPGCGAWGTIAERPAERGRSPGRASGPGGGRPAVSTLAATESSGSGERVGTGFAGLDRVLGGGLVPSSVVLLAGEPGIGKSTLLLHVMANLSVAGFTCLLASGEESRAQVSVRVRRLGLDGQRLSFTSGRELPEVLDAAVAEHPFLLAVDSIQTLRDPASASMPGGPSQVRGCADALVGLAKQEGIAVLFTGHVTKDGDLAGRRALAVEVQALVVETEGSPRRQAAGLDLRRFSLVAAVVDRGLRLPLSRSELYGASSGGLRIDDPGCDLAIAAALASAATGRPPPEAAAFVGEVSLTGQVRPAPGMPQRLAAAKGAGVRTVFAAGSPKSEEGLRVVSVRHVADALGWAGTGGRDRARMGREVRKM